MALIASVRPLLPISSPIRPICTTSSAVGGRSRLTGPSSRTASSNPFMVRFPRYPFHDGWGDDLSQGVGIRKWGSHDFQVSRPGRGYPSPVVAEEIGEHRAPDIRAEWAAMQRAVRRRLAIPLVLLFGGMFTFFVAGESDVGK